MTEVKTPAKATPEDIIDTVNWNEIPDQKDLEIWQRLTSNFWLPEKVPVSNDIPTWRNMTDVEKTATLRVFTGLTFLDTMQGTVGAISILPDSQTAHEEAVYTNIAFMESVHAKSYSNIFMTLSDTESINTAFRWSRENENLQLKGHRILDIYKNGTALEKKIASVVLESFLFYSGFYLPLRFSTLGRITNSADVIRLIIRDEAIHGYYIGYKFQQEYNKLPEWCQTELLDFTVELIFELYDNEIEYTRDIYDELGWTEDVGGYIRYNANKAMQNLGFPSLFPQSDCKFNAGVMSAMDSSSNENHDFFSGSGSSYVIGKAEATDDNDWDF